MAGLVPAAGTIRRIRGLHLLGHDTGAIADAALLPVATVAALAHMPTVAGRAIAEDIAWAVTAATGQLRATTGRSTTAHGRARVAGWIPLRAWDDTFNIDDPDADERLAARTVGMAPALRRAAIATARQVAREAARVAAQRAAAARNRAHRATHRNEHVA